MCCFCEGKQITKGKRIPREKAGLCAAVLMDQPGFSGNHTSKCGRIRVIKTPGFVPVVGQHAPGARLRWGPQKDASPPLCGPDIVNEKAQAQGFCRVCCSQLTLIDTAAVTSNPLNHTVRVEQTWTSFFLPTLPWAPAYEAASAWGEQWWSSAPRHPPRDPRRQGRPPAPQETCGSPAVLPFAGQGSRPL